MRTGAGEGSAPARTPRTRSHPYRRTALLPRHTTAEDSASGVLEARHRPVRLPVRLHRRHPAVVVDDVDHDQVGRGAAAVGERRADPADVGAGVAARVGERVVDLELERRDRRDRQVPERRDARRGRGAPGRARRTSTGRPGPRGPRPRRTPSATRRGRPWPPRSRSACEASRAGWSSSGAFQVIASEVIAGLLMARIVEPKLEHVLRAQDVRRWPSGWSCRVHRPVRSARHRGAMAKQKSFLLVGLPAHRCPAAHRGARAAPRRARGAGSPRARPVGRRGVPRRRRAAARAPGVGAAAQGRRRHLERDLPPGPQGATDRRRRPRAAGRCRPATEIALLVDGLAGTQLHVVVLAGVPDGRVGLFPDELDLGERARPLGGRRPHPDRLHVVATDPDRPDGRVARPRRAGRLRRRPAAAARPGRPVVTGGRGLAAADRRDAGVHVDHDELVELAEDWAQGRRRPRLRRASATCAAWCRCGPPTRPTRRARRTTSAWTCSPRRWWSRHRGGQAARAELAVSSEYADRKRSVRLPGVFVRGA